MHKTFFKLIGFFLLSLFCRTNCIAQSVGNGEDGFYKMIDFLPASPDATAMVKHTALEINKNTGSLVINIPLFNLKGFKLSAPVSLGYSSNGIKVDEIASRAGMGWSLTAGGVITRTIRGVHDENNTRLSVFNPIGDNCGTYDFADKVSSSTAYNSYDSEPDFFSFSVSGGISGGFVFDENMEPVLVPAEKYKIEKDFWGTSWNFKITDNEGVVYYFGGTGATEKTKRLTTCAKRSHDQPYPTAWYLTKIVHPNGEYILFTYQALTFTYDTGVSQSMNWMNTQIDYGIIPGTGAIFSCPSSAGAPLVETCVNKVQTEGVLLTKISTSFNSINFYYTDRPDCTDRLIDLIKYSERSVVIDSYKFTYHSIAADLNAYNGDFSPGYDQTPYLEKLTEFSPDENLESKNHYFSYNDPSARPPRLSFCQDHWGYFNGKHNTSFTPDLHTEQYWTRFPNAKADRNPDPLFAEKGMLTKIIYPTGGIDQIMYEPNTVSAQDDPIFYSTKHTLTGCPVIGIGFNQPQTKTVSFEINYTQYVELIVEREIIDPANYEEVHNNSLVALLGVNGGFPSTVFSLGITKKIVYLQPGTYTVEYKSYGAPIRTNVTVNFNPDKFPSAAKNRIVGGIRVKKILTGNPNEVPSVKHYYYADFDDLEKSSLYSVFWPEYVKEITTTVSCMLQLEWGSPGPSQAYFHGETIFSNSLNNLFNFQSAPVSYASVIESNGENFEGGAIQTKYYVHADARGVILWGDDIPGATQSNFSSYLNGKPKEEIIFKKGTNDLFPIKKTEYEYSIDPRAGTTIPGYAVNRKYIIYQPTASGCGTGGSTGAAAFDILGYSIVSVWAHPLQTTTTSYDENGQNPLVTVTSYTYDNLSNLQITSEETLDSKQQNIKTTYTYPQDHLNEQIYNDMISQHFISPVITRKVENTTLDLTLSEHKTDYMWDNIYLNNFIVPSVMKSSVRGNTLEKDGTFDLYDENGNLLQYTDKTGLVTSILWGYKKRFPVAKITGAIYSDCTAAIGAEFTNLHNLDGEELRNLLQLLRVHMPDKKITTYTYKPGAGVNSITDINNKTSYFEYDAFNRLLFVKDPDGNYLSKNEYNYGNPNMDASLKIYYNAELVMHIQCANCIANYSGNTVDYVIPAGKYYSFVSQADANQQASLDTGGQEYANTFGKCIHVCPE